MFVLKVTRDLASIEVFVDLAFGMTRLIEIIWMTKFPASN